MEALLISADTDGREANTSRYRILTPAKYLQQAGHTIRLQKNPGWENEAAGRTIPVDRGIDYTQIPEVVLIERNVQPDWIEKLRLAGAKRIIITFDDHYGAMPSQAAAKGWWDKYYSAFLKVLGMADLVIVPSQALVDAHRPYCSNIEYVPNYVDDDLWVDVKIDEPKEKVIGWGGSAEHLESWKLLGLGNALKKVLDEHPDWELHLHSGVAIAMGHLLPSGIKFHFGDWMPHTQWPSAMTRFGIGIAPLKGKYDRYRSNLKLVEYGMAKVPWIASSLDPYTRHDVLGGQVIEEKDWYRTLSELIASEEARKVFADIGHDWAQSYRMSRNVPVYEKILWSECKHA